ncbi:hypothetical protein CLF_101940 [Clonorchis sinensis]|uniref:Uncharacterized protein n=1 Tax=Clonorchis sinensis TaxID=79923 RepID=G7Y6X3_CLOSI|nr:hypothetical protein CLF_101940 [Clonorchis sinensis]
MFDNDSEEVYQRQSKSIQWYHESIRNTSKCLKVTSYLARCIYDRQVNFIGVTLDRKDIYLEVMSLLICVAGSVGRRMFKKDRLKSSQDDLLTFTDICIVSVEVPDTENFQSCLGMTTPNVKRKNRFRKHIVLFTHKRTFFEL